VGIKPTSTETAVITSYSTRSALLEAPFQGVRPATHWRECAGLTLHDIGANKNKSHPPPRSDSAVDLATAQSTQRLSRLFDYSTIRLFDYSMAVVINVVDANLLFVLQ
jgi:hypothetical protein